MNKMEIKRKNEWKEVGAMNSDLVSVIIPVYNVEAYLGRCIDSIRRQTYQNIEIILVDDGSPDHCGDICDQYAKLDSRIVVIHKENGGLSDARNRGIINAKGKYITFLDSDDYVAEDFVQYLHDLVVNNQADISCCYFVKTSEWDYKFSSVAHDDTVSIFTGPEACAHLMGDLYMPLVTAWGKLYRTDIVRQFDFPVGRLHEDEATTIKYYFSAEKVAIGKRQLYGYYQNSDSITHTRGEKSHTDAVWAFAHRATFLENASASELAAMAWSFYYSILIRDAVYHNHRSRNQLMSMLKRKDISLSKGIRFRLVLYKYTPRLFCMLYRFKKQ